MPFDRRGINVPHFLAQRTPRRSDSDELAAPVHWANHALDVTGFGHAIDQSRHRILRQQHVLLELYWTHGAVLVLLELEQRIVPCECREPRLFQVALDRAQQALLHAHQPRPRLDNGEVLTEGAAIVQYIADKQGATQLAPAAGTKERVRLQEWLNFTASELHKGFSPLFDSKTPEDYRTIVNENLSNKFAYLDKVLAGRDYLMGKTFTVADAYLFTILNWRHPLKIDISAYKNLQAYADRVGARPKVKEAMQAEGLLKAA